MQRRIDGIEALRALAASLVVAGHILDDAPQFGVVALTGLADLPVWQGGVDLFFVISGFIMVWTFGDKFGRSGAAREFLCRRIARIVPLYWLATLATAALLAVAPSLFDRAVLQARHLLLSLLFWPHNAPGGGTWPILGVGWTLNYEVLFYAIFAVGLTFRAGIGLATICATMVGLFVGARLIEPADYALAHFLADSVMLEFLLGVGIGFVVRRFEEGRALLLGIAALSLAVALLAPSPLDTVRAVRGGLPACALVCFAVTIRPPINGLLGRWVLRMGAASYALYLGHTIVLNLTKGMAFWMAALFSPSPAVSFVIYAVAAVALSLATALLVHRHVELPIVERVRAMLIGPSNGPAKVRKRLVDESTGVYR